MKRGGSQYKLFETEAKLENGLWYRPDFITEEEEEVLLVWIGGFDLTAAHSGAQVTSPTNLPEKTFYRAKRRHLGFGWSYDEEREGFVPGAPLPPFLSRFARRIEKWLDLPRGRVVEALINEYAVGTGLGWHKDKEPFEHVVGLSLGGWVKMRFRPSPGLLNRNTSIYGSVRSSSESIIGIELEPRSVYVMHGEVRDMWQHSVAPARTLRYSITFRTLPSTYRAKR